MLRGFLLVFAAWSVTAAPFDSTYQIPISPPTLIQGATILTAAGKQIAQGYVYFRDGQIVDVGVGDWQGDPPANLREIDGSGRWLTPGIIDVHSHLGNYPAPSYESHRYGLNIPSGPRIPSSRLRWPVGSRRCRFCQVQPI